MRANYWVRSECEKNLVLISGKGIERIINHCNHMKCHKIDPFHVALCSNGLFHHNNKCCNFIFNRNTKANDCREHFHNIAYLTCLMIVDERSLVEKKVNLSHSIKALHGNFSSLQIDGSFTLLCCYFFILRSHNFQQEA